jgi:hypothetical protein
MSARDVARVRAARSLAAGSTKAAAARAAEVDPGTITKWARDPTFQDLVLRAKEPVDDDPKAQATQGLADLVPQALKVLQDALNGADISPQQQTVALNVIKAAKQLEPAATSEGPSTLAAAIAEIDGSQPAR